MILAIFESVLVVLLLSYFFYRSIYAFVPLMIIGLFYFKKIYEKKKKKSINELNMQFKDCILSVSASLMAGYAVENAFMESREEVALLYGEEAYMFNELELIRRGLIINITLEELLGDFADRSNSEEIRQFAQIFSIAKRSGGSIPGIISTSAELIRGKLDTLKEIQTVLSGKRMELNIMKIMPFGILLYIGITYPGYFDSLYNNVKGVLIMTVCLLVYIIAYAMGDKTLNKIEIEMM